MKGHVDMGIQSDALDLIKAERTRQIDEEGFTPETEAERNRPGDLIAAAAAYLFHTAALRQDPDNTVAGTLPPSGWPFGGEWWKPTDHKRNVVKALALGLAELELILAEELEN